QPVLLLRPLIPPRPLSTLLPYTTLFRSDSIERDLLVPVVGRADEHGVDIGIVEEAPIVICADGAGQMTIGTSSTIPMSTPCSSRSEEHTSELQSRENLVCRLLLEKKKNR